LIKGRIDEASQLNSSFVFARWQHRTDAMAATCNCMLVEGSAPNRSFRCGSGTRPSNTMCHWTHMSPCHVVSKSVEQFKQVHECNRQTDDRQTDRPRYGKMCKNRRTRFVGCILHACHFFSILIPLFINFYLVLDQT